MNATCPMTSPCSTSRICPLRIMCMSSYPCNVFHAVSAEKKPRPGLTLRLMKRWSYSTMLLRYFTCRSSQALGMAPSSFSSLNAFG